MLSGRASARLSAITVPVAITLAAWLPRFGAERLSRQWSVAVTLTCALIAGLLVLDALRIERAARRDLRARRSGDPRKRPPRSR